MASSGAGVDKYRSYLYGEEEKHTQWRYGGPPNYDAVNKLFEEGRTKVIYPIANPFRHIHTCVCVNDQ